MKSLFRRLFGAPERPPDKPPPLPDGFTASGRRYPAELLKRADVQALLKAHPSARITLTPDKKTFTIAARREEYPALWKRLSSLKDRR